MKSTNQQVSRLRKLLDKDGLGDKADAMVAEITKDNDPKLIRPLLFIRPYSKDDPDHLHELWFIMGAVEAFPIESYTEELSASLEELCDYSSWFLDHLLARLSNSKPHTDHLVEAILRHPIAKPNCVLQVISNIRKNSTRADQQTSLDRIEEAVLAKKR